MDKIKILYITTTVSERLADTMIKNRVGLPNLAAQKYHRLLLQGIALNEKELFNLEVIGIPEYNVHENKRYIPVDRETELGVNFLYSPIYFKPVIKHLFIALFLIKKVYQWKKRHSNEEKCYIFFDILNFSNAIFIFMTSKLLGIKTISIVTDHPELMFILKEKVSFRNKIRYKIQSFILSLTDGYIFLTEGLNSAINKKNKPYCIIEGLADIRRSITTVSTRSSDTKILHYSGGLYEKFGVKSLVDAFMKIKNQDITLELFGNGDLTDYIKHCAKIDSRVKLYGYRENHTVLAHQQNSYLLINPRFSKEKYNRYSFPSKTIEYMSSGIPLLTTKLEGIPKDYLDYVYIFEDETVEGYANKIIELLRKPHTELLQIGIAAKKYVLENKNNKIQSYKIYRNFN